MKKLSDLYRMQRRHPLGKGAFFLVCAVFGFATLWAAFLWGGSRAGYNHLEQTLELDELQLRVREQEAGYAEMLQKNTELERSSQIDKKARQDVAHRLDVLNAEMLELKEELVFYRSLLTPSDHDPALSIQNFRAVQDGRSPLFNFKLVLAQLRKHDNFASGTINLYLQGVDGKGEVRNFAFKDLTEEKQEIVFRFKYFQNLEGDLRVPEGFKPLSVRIHVIPTGRELHPVEQTYEWKTVVAGG